MNKYASIWTNPLSIFLVFLVLVWIFTIAKFCNHPKTAAVPDNTQKVESPIPNYILLPEIQCPLKLSEGDGELAGALLQQYFRMDSLNRFQEAVWRPDPKLDQVFARQYEGNWETYIECIQTLQEDSTGRTEKIAILASNYPDNDCSDCAPYVGDIRFSMQGEDLATIVIHGSNRALFTFGAYGAIGDQISLIDLGPYQALAFTSYINWTGYNLRETTIYKVDDFRELLRVQKYESNGGTEEKDLFEREGTLYIKQDPDALLPAKLALYQSTTLLNQTPEKVMPPEIIYYQYEPDSLHYIKVK